MSALVLLASCGAADEVGVDETPSAEGMPFLRLHHDEIAFVHISDIHESPLSLQPACDYLNTTPCSFGLLTGDILATDEIKTILRSTSKPFFLIPGNHDAYERGGEAAFRLDLLDMMQPVNQVTCGSPTGNYWYRDVSRGGKRLRIIALDQFQVDHYAKKERWSPTLLTQEQVDWFVSTLQSSYDFDGIIVMMHEGFGNDVIGQRDPTQTGTFISLHAVDNPRSYEYAGNYNTLLIPDIVNDYQTGENLINSPNANANPRDIITVNTAFDGPHDNFVAYFGGHAHFDIVETLSDYPRQLQVIVAFGGYLEGSEYNDLIKTEQGEDSYTINLNVIDFTTRQLHIRRLGSQHKVDGTLRQEATFGF